LSGKDSSTTAMSELTPGDDKLEVSVLAEVVVVVGAVRVRW
jgi:hypothetical protein